MVREPQSAQNAEGRVHRLIGTTFNISDRKRAEAQLNQRTAELEQTLQELQRTQTQMVQSEKCLVWVNW